MKLVIQIPCYNEEQTIAETLSSIPQSIEGIDDVNIVVINDGSTDKSSEIAKTFGAVVVDLKQNKGLANAFRAGLQKSLELGADIIVNTDADNQYCASDIDKLIKPILEDEADMVIGARDIVNIKEFSLVKKCLQKLGSAVLRLFSSTDVKDAPSGFRAFSKEAALKLNIFDNYTYTMETIIQASAKGLRIKSVPISVNETKRKSKLVKNIPSYVIKSTKTILRMFIVYRPFRFFVSMASVFGVLGLFLALRFIYFYINGSGNGHVQSLIFSAIFLISSVQLIIVAVIGDLLSINRKLLEDIQTRIKRIELK